MNWLRKTDWYVQITIIVVALCTIPYLGFYLLLYAQIFLGCLQLIGGAIHAFTPLPSIFQKAVKRYWIFVFGYFFYSQLLHFLNKWIETHSNIFFIIQYMIIPWIIAGYYLYWYKKLINHIEYHREFEGLIKS